MTGARFTASWLAHRGYLVDLAYRMLGDVGAAEDVVQEAFARLASASEDILDERGWLTVVTSRLCLDQIRSARARHEHPQDTALLEQATPIATTRPVDPADRITLDDQVRSALAVVLARLGPDERVVFVLHDVFAVPFDTIAETVGRPVATCRQLARRARGKISQSAGEEPVPFAEHRVITEKFITACTNGDIDGLVSVLHPDVWGRAAFGDASMQPQTNHGADRVAKGLMFYYHAQGAVLVTDPGGDSLALLGFLDRRQFATIQLTVEGGLIMSIDVQIDLANALITGR
ncbi:MAG TPA: RNA polymerase sigma factor SigI [Pseudonocardiaceae bacterium]|jgi:RNA polymerase sigma-70 factor (ECF subfamily)